jgi:hypothetical protein
MPIHPLQNIMPGYIQLSLAEKIHTTLFYETVAHVFEAARQYLASVELLDEESKREVHEVQDSVLFKLFFRKTPLNPLDIDRMTSIGIEQYAITYTLPAAYLPPMHLPPLH